MVGDPTEGALVVAAAKAGLWRDEGAKTLPRVAEIPFDSERKRMTTIHQVVAGSRRKLRDCSALHFAGDYVALSRARRTSRWSSATVISRMTRSCR